MNCIWRYTYQSAVAVIIEINELPSLRFSYLTYIVFSIFKSDTHPPSPSVTLKMSHFEKRLMFTRCLLPMQLIQYISRLCYRNRILSTL